MSLTDFVKAEKVEMVTKIYNKLGVRDQTEKKINEYFKSAYQSLDHLQLDPSRLIELRSYADYLTHRDR